MSETFGFYNCGLYIDASVGDEKYFYEMLARTVEYAARKCDEGSPSLAGDLREGESSAVEEAISFLQKRTEGDLVWLRTDNGSLLLCPIPED